ncbi:type VI secretion system baseplate subunit TssG, partial [Zoogloea sp.]|uniref:type VI secretion system baseplate subunit TssG n=1 Tax=Zoogloea sp. TaxID=49181 RepID=UPI0025E39461
LSGLKPGQAGRPPRLEVRFFGLFGPNGPLPLHLTEYASGRQLQAGDPSFARFADIIHHRFLGLFHRAWAQAQPCASLDRPGDDSFGRYVGALAGIGLPGLRQRDALPDFAKLHHAGLLNRQVRNAEGLGQLVEGFFRVPVSVEQFVGHWMAVRPRDHARLGRAGNVLGRSALVGRHYQPLFDWWQGKDAEKAKAWKVCAADFVDLSTGSGIVHMAPAFGADDYALGQKEGLP